MNDERRVSPIEPQEPVDPEAADDRDWIRAAVDEYERPLVLYAARLVQDVDRARDVVQDTFLRLWQADRAAVEGHLVKWLYTVCRNRALDVRRKEHRMTTLEDPQTRVVAGEPGLHAEDPPEGGLVAYVADLPERQQEAVRLKFQGGLSYREIAEVMDTTVNNVGVTLHTAIKTIRRRLEEATGPNPIPAAAGDPGTTRETP